MIDLFEVHASDLEISIWPPSKVGGQHVGTSNGVKIVHLPTGLEAVSIAERSQHLNRQIAMDMILGGITSPALRHYKPQG